MKHTDIKSLRDWCERKVIKDPNIIFYFALAGTGRTREKDKTIFKYPDIPISPTEQGAMRPGFTYLIVCSDKERCQFACQNVTTDAAVATILDRVSGIRDDETRKDMLQFLSEQLMRGVQINERLVGAMERLTIVGDDANEKKLRQAQMIADIQDKQASLQERLDKAETREASIKGALILANKVVDRLIVGKEALAKDVADGMGVNRLLAAEGVTPQQARAALELLRSNGVSFMDLINDAMLPQGTEQSTEQVPETETP